MNEFLNGESMITPGVAGALVIVISNTAFVEFGIPSKWSSLILSFLLGTLVFAGTVAPAVAERSVLFIKLCDLFFLWLLARIKSGPA